ncbi:MAG TPA: SRPBCC domain-containing protein [Alphaproteobacteria bacterium]|nr:SRPBCC domain-containing protein [Alphaproteobacteria bacterium]
MDMKGEFRIPLSQDVVWRALNDAAILKASIPGCEELVRESDTSFKGRISAAVGPVRAKFSGQATLSDIDAPNGYTLTGSGSGGAAGMAKGGATVRLVTEGAETVLRYEAHAQVAGKLAQIGARLVDMTAKKMADDFFTNFVAQLSPATPVAAAPEPTPIAPGAAAPVRQPETVSNPRPSWLVWAIIVIVTALAGFLLWYAEH